MKNSEGLTFDNDNMTDRTVTWINDNDRFSLLKYSYDGATVKYIILYS